MVRFTARYCSFIKEMTIIFIVDALNSLNGETIKNVRDKNL